MVYIISDGLHNITESERGRGPSQAVGMTDPGNASRPWTGSRPRGSDANVFFPIIEETGPFGKNTLKPHRILYTFNKLAYF